MDGHQASLRGIRQQSGIGTGVTPQQRDHPHQRQSDRAAGRLSSASPKHGLLATRGAGPRYPRVELEQALHLPSRRSGPTTRSPPWICGPMSGQANSSGHRHVRSFRWLQSQFQVVCPTEGFRGPGDGCLDRNFTWRRQWPRGSLCSGRCRRERNRVGRLHCSRQAWPALECPVPDGQRLAGALRRHLSPTPYQP